MVGNRKRWTVLVVAFLTACTGTAEVSSVDPGPPSAAWGSAFAPAAGVQVRDRALLTALESSANAVAGCAASVSPAARSLPADRFADALEPDTARAVAAAGNVVAVAEDGRQIVDLPGSDVIRAADGSTSAIAGEGRALLPSALGGEDVLVVAPDSRGFAGLQRLGATGAVTVALPPEARGVWEAVAVRGGGLVASLVEETGHEDVAERVNLWALAPDGTWTRLTTYEPDDVGGVHHVTTLNHLAVGPKGTVYATALRYATNGGDGGFRSTQVIVDPTGRRVTVGRTLGGEVRFGIDATGADRVGVDQTGAIRWYRLDGTDAAKGGTCDAQPPAAYLPDPDLLGS